MFIEEEYRWIPGYEGKYKVSNKGDVVSYCFSTPRSIYQTTNNCGYKQVKLITNGVEKHMYVHRLVAMLFVPCYEDGLEVNHKDKDRSNNTYTNLEWVTKSKNHKHRCKDGDRTYVPSLGWVSSDYKRKKSNCVDCGKEITYRAIRCLSCDRERRRRSWPSEDQLKNDLLTLNFCEMGRKYSLTGNSVRKICKFYGLPYSSAGVKEYRNGPLAQSVRAVVS